MAKNQTQPEPAKRGVHCDPEEWAKLSDEIDSNPKKFRPMTAADHLSANRNYLVRNLSKGLSVGELASLFREKKILDVSDQTLRKFVKDNNLGPAKPAKAPKVPTADAPKTTPASAPKAPIGKAA